MDIAIDYATKPDCTMKVMALVSAKDKKVKILSIERIDNNEDNTTSNRESKEI